ncbi:MAG: glycosyltransferase family 2 protein [Chloroflexota bacterium]|nr:glycosyltransferase family 2 protein [Chloroflexota bacterium]
MAPRLLAGAFLLASAVLAWLAISVWLAARLLQAAIALSIVYVGYLAWQGWRVMRRAFTSRTAVPLSSVSIVVPARDESAVIERLVGDLAALREADVLIVDDGSADGTGDLARAVAADVSHIRVVRREPGSGPATKGAVLNFASPHLRGDILLVLDADARVAADLLERLGAGWERDPSAIAVQGLRRPQNAAASWLGAAQAEEQLFDTATQCGRWATDGTAELRGNGMAIRRTALEALGGWNPVALTEDLDLSTRLQAAGEHVAMAPEAAIGEQAVAEFGALWRQRMRWAEGSVRRLLEHGPRLLVAPLPLRAKLDFLAFTAEFLVPPLFVTTLVASLATIPLPQPADWSVPASLFMGYGLGVFVLALAALHADGRRGLALVGGSLRGSLFLSHWLLVVPVALVRIALGPSTVTFSKTPRDR